MHYTEKELEQLIKSVEKEFSADLSLAKSESVETLAKAEDKPEQREEKPEHKEEDRAEEQERSGEDAQHAERPEHEEREEHEMSGEHEKADMAAPGHDYDEEDMEHLHKMYMSMSRDEQQVHHDALAKCMMKADGMVKAEKEIEQEAPVGPKGERSEASKVDGSRMDKLKKGENPRRGSGGQMEEQKLKDTPGAKSEASFTKNKELYKDEDGIERQEPKNALGPKSDASYTPNKELYDMGKSEDFEMLKSELDAQKVKSETLQKTLDGVTEFLTKLVKKANVPQGKAVTSYDVIAKSEGADEQPMTKSEIVEILSKKAQDPNLSKTDREAINAFYLNNASVNSISHLLKS
jgi:hypothetical protein